MNIHILAQYQSIRKEIIEIKDRINQIRYNAMHPTCPQITDMPRASGYSNDGMVRIVIQIEELTELYMAKQIELNDLCIEIEKEIAGLESLERRIIRLRYFEGLTWEEIGNTVDYSTAQLNRIHRKILEKLQR